MKTKLVLSASLMLSLASSGCSLTPRETVILDPSVPHRLSKPVEVTVWARKLDGSMQEITATAPAGSWIASAQIVEPQPPRPTLSNLGTP